MASTVTEMLRRRFGGKEEVDPLEGWTLDYRLNRNGEIAAANHAISPYFRAEGVVYYFLGPNTGAGLGIWVYYDNLQGVFLQWAQAGSQEHSFTMPTTRTYFRISMYIPNMANAYIKDSNNNYIWKGKNV